MSLLSVVFRALNQAGTAFIEPATADKQLPNNHQVQVSNFPATQPVSGSVSVSNFPATQAVSGTVTANLGTLNGAALDSSLQALNNKMPDESGTWGYNAGTAGTLTVAANKRILQISATAPALAAATMTINGGQTITIPAGSSLTVSPKANVTAPTIVFTGTASYFVEFIE